MSKKRTIFGTAAALLMVVTPESYAETMDRLQSAASDRAESRERSTIPSGEEATSTAPTIPELENGKGKPPNQRETRATNEVRVPDAPMTTSRSPSPTEPAVTVGGRSFALYALSRGRGVPEQALAALGAFREQLDREHSALLHRAEERIGLEGETRICVEFATQTDAQRVLAQVHELTAKIDLMDVRIEPCLP